MTLPKYPTPQNKHKKIRTIKGKKRIIEVVDQIAFQQNDNKKKLIVFQKMLVNGKRKEYRFGYYMIGVKPRMKGRWTWGESALMIPQKDVRKLFKLIKAKKWL